MFYSFFFFLYGVNNKSGMREENNRKLKTVESQAWQIICYLSTCKALSQNRKWQIQFTQVSETGFNLTQLPISHPSPPPKIGRGGYQGAKSRRYPLYSFIF